MVYEAVFCGLNGAGVRYLIVGAVAVNLHGVPRMTADLDVMIDLAGPNLRSFVDTMVALGYRPRAPVSPADLLDAKARRTWRETKGMVTFTWIHPDRPYEEVDLFLENPIEFAPAYARRVEVAAGTLSLPIACIQDLVALKRLAGRAQDRSDIDALMQLQRLAEEEKA